ncbi:GntR family transcriptional regulator [Nocardia sp. NPDC050406]|uniref:GntR family transcriptional regulator n=1 Tax=Nocardia sp. NPDC050406 TaxID=3364318 RepID=UPI00379CC15D
MARRGRIPLSERVYRALQRDLAAGVLVPTERLGEERLAEIYGVSRTPVREALARLLADGLVERHPGGLYPYRPRLDELADLFELRILLESQGIHRARRLEPADEQGVSVEGGGTGGPSAPAAPSPSCAAPEPAAPPPTFSAGKPAAPPPSFAVREPAPPPPTLAVREPAPLPRRHDAAILDVELDIWRHLRSHPPAAGAELIAADERFHLRVLAASGNAALADALGTVHARVRPIRALDMPTPERIAAMTADHIAIAEQLLAGDLDHALRSLVAHITMSRDHVLARAEHALRLTKLARALRD